MGILNATPDSFANDGASATIADARRMIADGADILDIGGESTRPGALPVDPAEEQRRILPLLRELTGCGVPLSVDTRNASTMEAALDAGASIINDISGLMHDPRAAALLAGRGCTVVIMHMRGTPQTMSALTDYRDVVADVQAELGARIHRAEQAGIARDRMVIDPGIGFAKTPDQSVALLRNLSRFLGFGLPILAGVSRKAFVGTFSGEPDPVRRAPGSVAASLFAVQQGATILRVHDVRETVQAVHMWQTLTAASKD